ncbi:hypothetical protein [Amycolatopsis pigmentata]|uniref:Electron transfer flavoprotein alpha/beta-subunit N-terminal domain-containing protein n=1 Tax=Amycolatopsis pigmentata TaxID=450801 RepID=A0ABW5FNH1_9PSEU
MAEVLVLVDHLDGQIRRSTLELLTVARGLGEPSAVAVGPVGTTGKLSAELKSHGASKIYLAETDSGDFVTPQVELLSALLEAGDAVTLLAGAMAGGREIAARVARKTGHALVDNLAAVVVGDHAARTTAATTMTASGHRLGKTRLLACAAGYPDELDE